MALKGLGTLLARKSPPPSPDEREVLIAYLTEELKVAVLKDKESNRFYAGSPTNRYALQRFAQATQELVNRHSHLDAPKNGKANYRAWHRAYQAYESCVSRMTSEHSFGNEPRPNWVQDWTYTALRASRQTQKLHEMLGLTSADVAEMLWAAEVSLAAEPWKPEA